jgi:alkylmercury lyase
VELRELAFGLLLRDRTPIPPDELAALVGATRPIVVAALDGLAREGRIDRDRYGRVLGSAGLTLADGPHGLEIDGHAFRTWCAFDALGIPAALGVDARVATGCAVCGRHVGVDVRAGRPIGENDARLWLSAGGADMRADFCTPTVLLCSDVHARTWAERQAGRGRVLTLVEATVEGARSWASAAATAARVQEGRS